MTQSIQIETFREVMGNYPTGVAIITAVDQEGSPVGLTVNSFASVSLDPLLILWSIDHKASSLDAFLHTNQFAVHILAHDQRDLCYLFAKKGADRFHQCAWSFSEQHLPMLDGVAASLQCQVFNKVEAGDHTILIGEVNNIEQTDIEPLLFHKGNIGPFADRVYS